MGSWAGRRLGGWAMIAAVALTVRSPNRLTAQSVASNPGAAYPIPTNAKGVTASWMQPDRPGAADRGAPRPARLPFPHKRRGCPRHLDQPGGPREEMGGAGVGSDG